MTKGSAKMRGELFPILLDQFRDQGGPAGLMAGTDAGAVVAVKIFVERDEIAPMIITLEFFRAAEDRPASGVVAQEDSRQTLRNLAGHIPKVRQLARTRGAFDFIIVAQKKVKLLQRLDEQVIDREPDRSTPIGIAA